MSLQVQRVSKEVLSSYANTRTFLEGKSTLIEIAKQRDLFLNQPLAFTTKHVVRNRFWQISDRCTYPIRIFLFYLSIFLSLSIALQFPSLGLRVYLIGKRIKRGFKDCCTTTKTHSYTIGPCNKENSPRTSQSTFSFGPGHRILNSSMLPLALKPENPVNKVTFLSWAINHPQKNLPEIQLLQTLEVTDPKLQKRTTTSKLKFSTEGVCKGVSLWFVYLYLQTKHLFSDAQKQMITIAKIFANGAPIEAALLHEVKTKIGNIIDLSFGAPGFLTPNPVQTIALAENTKKRQIANPSLAGKELDNLNVGAYLCHYPTHMVSFVKISSNLCYLFDPNTGILEFAGPDLGAELLAWLNETCYFNDESINEYRSDVESISQNLPSWMLESKKKNCPSFKRDREIQIYSIQLRERALHIGPAPEQIG